MQKKTIELEPLPTEWGDIYVIAVITTKEKQNTLEWKTQYPAAMPPEKQHEIDGIIATYMDHQHTELVQMFGD